MKPSERSEFDEFHDLVQALTDALPNALDVATLIGRLIDAKLSASAGQGEGVRAVEYGPVPFLNYCVICAWSGCAASCPRCDGDRGLLLYVRAGTPWPEFPEPAEAGGEEPFAGIAVFLGNRLAPSKRVEFLNYMAEMWECKWRLDASALRTAANRPTPNPEPLPKDDYGNDPEAYRSGCAKLTEAEFIAIHKDAFDEGFSAAMSANEPTPPDAGQDDESYLSLPGDRDAIDMYVFAMANATPQERAAWANLTDAERDFFRTAYRFAKERGESGMRLALAHSEGALSNAAAERAKAEAQLAEQRARASREGEAADALRDCLLAVAEWGRRTGAITDAKLTAQLEAAVDALAEGMKPQPGGSP